MLNTNVVNKLRVLIAAKRMEGRSLMREIHAESTTPPRKEEAMIRHSCLIAEIRKLRGELDSLQIRPRSAKPATTRKRKQ